MVYYLDFTKGSATSFVFTPCGSAQHAANTPPSGFYGAVEYQQTIADSGSYVVRVPIEALGTNRTVGGFFRGVGTMTSSSVTGKIKFEVD
jgi:hypothetical protein